MAVGCCQLCSCNALQGAPHQSPLDPIEIELPGLATQFSPSIVHDDHVQAQSHSTRIACEAIEQGAALLLHSTTHAPAAVWLGRCRSITVTSFQSQFTCSEIAPSRGGVSRLSSFANWAVAIMVLGVMSFVLALVVAAVASCKLRGARKRHAAGGLSDLLPVTTPKVRTKPCCRRMYCGMRCPSSAAAAAGQKCTATGPHHQSSSRRPA